MKRKTRFITQESVKKNLGIIDDHSQLLNTVQNIFLQSVMQQMAELNIILPSQIDFISEFQSDNEQDNWDLLRNILPNYTNIDLDYDQFVNKQVSVEQYEQLGIIIQQIIQPKDTASNGISLLNETSEPEVVIVNTNESVKNYQIQIMQYKDRISFLEEEILQLQLKNENNVSLVKNIKQDIVYIKNDTSQIINQMNDEKFNFNQSSVKIIGQCNFKILQLLKYGLQQTKSNIDLQLGNFKLFTESLHQNVKVIFNQVSKLTAHLSTQIKYQDKFLQSFQSEIITVNQSLLDFNMTQVSHFNELSTTLLKVKSLQQLEPDVQGYFVQHFDGYFDVFLDDEKLQLMNQQLSILEEQLTVQENQINQLCSQLQNGNSLENNMLHQQYVELSNQYMILEEQNQHCSEENKNLTVQLYNSQKHSQLLSAEISEQKEEIRQIYEKLVEQQDSRTYIEQNQLERIKAGYAKQLEKKIDESYLIKNQYEKAMEQLQSQMKENRLLQSENDKLIMQNMELSDFHQKALVLFKDIDDVDICKNKVNELLLEFSSVE